jgi:DNA-binding protein YbaB
MGKQTGLLADVQKLEQEIQDAQQAIKTTTATAPAADHLVEATVSGTGELVELVLDPRVYREFAPDVLAGEIVAAVRAAWGQAQEDALETWSATVPDLGVPADGDVTFGPMLGELRRMRTEGNRR